MIAIKACVFFGCVRIVTVCRESLKLTLTERFIGMRRTKLHLLLMLGIFLSVGVNACKKDSDDGTSLGGDWNVELTRVGSEFGLTPKFGDSELPGALAYITRNESGLVTFKLSSEFDLSGRADSAVLKSLIDFVLSTPYLSVDEQGLFDLEFKMKMTSEGFQWVTSNGDYQTVMKYNDPVGTTYKFVDKTYTNKTIEAVVTERTGIDEWPLVFWLIKTSKVDINYPDDYPLIKKLEVRANHKFGIVYVEATFKNGEKGTLNVVPWDML